MRKLSRMEANKEVRRTLNKHGVDLSYAQYSVSGYDIRLTGWLCKSDTSNFNASQIDNMVQEFQRILPGYSISGDFDNWSFTGDHISCLDGGNEVDGVQEEGEVVYSIDYSDSDSDSEAG